MATTTIARSLGTRSGSTSEAGDRKRERAKSDAASRREPARRAFSGAPWEAGYGYCRAVREGDRVWVSGTAAVGPDGAIVAPGDMYAQTRRCIEIIASALAELGADLAHVRRTRVFVTDIARWEEVGRAHREAFGEHPPAATMVEVTRLIDPSMLVEIEADAIVAS